ncbi:chemotaxis protein CheW [Paenibacillus turpanensis]|uniref:chemotaxis protein CheW n=1 Tax=Paenibacillus turpanensis TaxID=2689078 RepID=UPI0014085072|nr:chemotaxis protein CheW [Paenibacillus turpanensis]
MKETGRGRQWVTFYLNEQLYGLPIETVKGIVRMERVTRVPFAEPYLEGLINQRGTLLTVVNGSRWIGHKSEHPPQKILILQGRERSAGLAVDRIADVMVLEGESGRGSDADALGQYEGFVMRGDTVIRVIRAEAVLDAVAGTGHGSKQGITAVGGTAPGHSSLQGEDEAQREDALPILQFAIAGESYALPMKQVKEIAPMPEKLEPIQGMPSSFMGLGLFRDGRMMPVVNTAVLLFGQSVGRPARVICVELPTATGVLRIGLAVSQVNEVRRLRQDAPVGMPGSFKQLADGIQSVHHLNGSTKPIFLLGLEHLLDKTGVLPFLISSTAAGTWKSPESAAAALGLDAGAETTVGLSAHGAAKELYVFFRLQGQEFGIPAAKVREITRVTPIRQIPFAPDGVAGLTNIRGQLVTVVDANEKLQLGSREENLGQLVVMQGRGASRCIGVEQVTRVLSVSLEQLQQAGLYRDDLEFRWLKGFYKESDARFIPLIDPAAWE